jgi:hypothetical protein
VPIAAPFNNVFGSPPSIRKSAPAAVPTMAPMLRLALGDLHTGA